MEKSIKIKPTVVWNGLGEVIVEGSPTWVGNFTDEEQFNLSRVIAKAYEMGRQEKLREFREFLGVR